MKQLMIACDWCSKVAPGSTSAEGMIEFPVLDSGKELPRHRAKVKSLPRGNGKAKGFLSLEWIDPKPASEFYNLYSNVHDDYTINI